jgi:glycerol-3-phosphate O-acyltransferase/dihydroxyacetone phosphate acyltransferase
MSKLNETDLRFRRGTDVKRTGLSIRHASDRAMTALARLLVRVFFRSLELQHPENLPDSGPVVLVANHRNGLVDALLLMATLGRYPRFLGKSTLFKIVPLWPFLKLAGVIPVYRAMDGVSGDHNAAAFTRSREILDGHDMVALFPEGISHDESSLQPLKTGAARIALEASADGGVEGVVIVAAGLTYDAKARFRSRALVRIGEPMSVAAWRERYRVDSHLAVRQLTEEVAQRLETVSPSYSTWEQANLFTRMAEVLVRRTQGPRPGEVTLAARIEAAERLSLIGEAEQSDGCRSTFARYERGLELLGLSDAQVAAEYPHRRLRLSLLGSMAKLVIALPFAAIGFVVHVVPFQIVKQLAKKPTNEGIRATVKLLGCTALFAIVYVALGVVVGRAYGGWVGFAVAAGAPACGYVSVRLAERVKRIGGVLEGYRTLSGRRDVLDSVVSDRASFVTAATRVLQNG